MELGVSVYIFLTYMELLHHTLPQLFSTVSAINRILIVLCKSYCKAIPVY